MSNLTAMALSNFYSTKLMWSSTIKQKGFSNSRWAIATTWPSRAKTPTISTMFLSSGRSLRKRLSVTSSPTWLLLSCSCAGQSAGNGSTTWKSHGTLLSRDRCSFNCSPVSSVRTFSSSTKLSSSEIPSSKRSVCWSMHWSKSSTGKSLAISLEPTLYRFRWKSCWSYCWD